MQSLLQYRRAGAAAQAQIDRDIGKARQHTQPNAGHDVEAGVEGRKSLDEKDEPNSGRLPPITEADTCASSDEIPEQSLQQTMTAQTIRQCKSGGIAIGQVLTGINVQDHKNDKGHDGKIFVVNWEGPNDPLDPHNWSIGRRIGVTLQISIIALFVGAASGIDATVLPQAAESLGVSEVAESLATGMFGPLSVPNRS
ncbi:hypothetical protein LB503_010313 [Fusarium chuoi]|nr:hypothetical protein LB503_010313 [Fusarium chuoi]